LELRQHLAWGLLPQGLRTACCSATLVLLLLLWGHTLHSLLLRLLLLHVLLWQR
jgi:hypothetical protein